MTATPYRVRRATVDDLSQLGPLLKATLLPADELERRFTEFQVVEGADNQLVGALGLQIAGKHGKLHSESYLDFGMADTLRPLLWERIQSVAQNHGLVRLWTQETAPFWKQAGMVRVEEDVKKFFPAQLGVLDESWLTLKLKEDIEQIVSLDKEFALFMESEKARTEELFAQAKVFKGIAYILAICLLLFVIGAGLYVFKNMRHGGF